MEVFDLGHAGFAFIFIAVFFAAFISSVTGMAGGVLMFTALHTFIPLRPLIAIHGCVQIVNNAVRSWLLKNNLRRTACVYFAIGAAIGTTATTLLILEYVGELTPLVILFLLLIYSLFKPKRLPSFQINDPQFFWVGLCTGSLGMLAGAIDPFLSIFFLRKDYTKEEIVANKSMMQFIAHSMKIPAFIYLGFSFQEYLPLIAMLSISAIMGSKLGVLALNKISTSLFFRIMWWALFLSSLHIAVKIFEQIF